MKHILLSNDDGYHALGINILREELLKHNYRVTIVAPVRNRSAVSNSLTVRNSLKPILIKPDIWSVDDGTPTDCVHLATCGLLDFEPDAFISGVNDSANLGDDTIYSGTVAAAIEARHLECPKLALSMIAANDKTVHFETACHFAIHFLEYLWEHPDQAKPIYNFNVPNVPVNQIKGCKITHLGTRKKSLDMIEFHNAHGELFYRAGAAGEPIEDDSNSDFNAIKDGFVSITPLKTDYTDHNMLQTFPKQIQLP